MSHLALECARLVSLVMMRHEQFSVSSIIWLEMSATLLVAMLIDFQHPLSEDLAIMAS
jgi:hypothetical protein